MYVITNISFDHLILDSRYHWYEKMKVEFKLKNKPNSRKRSAILNLDFERVIQSPYRLKDIFFLDTQIGDDVNKASLIRLIKRHPRFQRRIRKTKQMLNELEKIIDVEDPEEEIQFNILNRSNQDFSYTINGCEKIIFFEPNQENEILIFKYEDEVYYF